MLIDMLKNKNKIKLEEFVSKITPDNIHSEVDWGKSIGKEIW